VKRLEAVLDAIVRLFDVAGRKREREAAAARETALARAAEHEALQDMLEAVLSRVQQSNAGQTEALIEVAKGTQEVGKAISTWMDLFKNNQGDGFSHTVRPAQEVEEHEARERERLKKLGYPVDEPPDAQMAFLDNIVAQAFGQRFEQ
jgi:hypothetical protein